MGCIGWTRRKGLPFVALGAAGSGRTKEYGDLDAHQKTILSDDFGMGFTTDFLMNALGLRMPVDGRYFAKSMSGPQGTKYSGQSKRGPAKSPDFVAEDASGKWHVIECKGTQSGLREHEKQLRKGCKQKATIEFPPHAAGERLVAGMLIGTEGTKVTSKMSIVDPPKRGNLRVTEELVGKAADASMRGTLAVALQLAGFPATASVVSAPDGTDPSAIQMSGLAERVRLDVVQAKQRASREELAAAAGRFLKDGYIGRAIELDLPGLRELSDGRLTTVHVTNGISTELVKRLLEPAGYETGQPLSDQASIDAGELAFKREGAGNQAELSIGQMYRATLRLT